MRTQIPKVPGKVRKFLIPSSKFPRTRHFRDQSEPHRQYDWGRRYMPLPQRHQQNKQNEAHTKNLKSILDRHHNEKEQQANKSNPTPIDNEQT